MKVFLTTLYAIVCIIFIGASHYFWTEKTIVQEASAEVKDKPTQKDGTQEKAKDKDKEDKKTGTARDDKQQEKYDQLIMLTKNWPEQSVAKFKQALKDETPFKIVIAGSPALGGETGWAALTKANLLEAFGSKVLSVEIKVYDTNTSAFITDGHLQGLASLQADMILFEPFILKSNGIVPIAKSLENLTTIITTVKQTSPDTVFLLQPSFPLYKAKNYPIQVDQLKQYAFDNGIQYLDHWTSWPATESEEIKQYLEADQSLPNQTGHDLWSEYVSSILISK